MPALAKSNRTLAITSSSCSSPMMARTGAVWEVLTVGLALCATTQMEQDALSVCLAWRWVDSAVAIPSIRNRHSQADHRIQRRISTSNSHRSL